MTGFHPITAIGVAGGFLGAIAMAIAYDRLTRGPLLPTDYVLGKYVGERPEDFPVAGLVLYIGLGTVLGGLYPFVFRGLLGFDGRYIAELPYTFLTAFAFALVLFGFISALVAVDVVHVPSHTTISWMERAVPLLVYATVLAVVTGLSRPFWYPIIGM